MNIILTRTSICLVFLFFLLGCKEQRSVDISLPQNTELRTLNIEYAKGFAITNNTNHTILEIKSPWPDAEKSFRYVLISPEEAAKTTFMQDTYDGIILTPIESLVVTSTTHIPALELLGAESKLVGFPGTDYISSKKTRRLIDNNIIRELGKNESINTEVLLELMPDVVIGFGVDGINKTFNTIQKANIPVIYNGDWTEASALAKAEWIKFFGVLLDKEREADSIFNQIKKDYNSAKQLAEKVTKRPTVLSGAMHKDVWYLPNGSSPEAQLLKDANTDYLWSETNGSGSLALSFETVLDKAKNADLWLSPSYYTSFEALKKANPHYTKFDAFKNRKVYTFSRTTGETGGVLYYEQGTARPDLVLKDIIKICHPELLKEYNPYFFKQLE